MTPVCRLSVHSVAVMVPENSPFKSVSDVVNLAKKENKPVTAAVSGAASPSDIVAKAIGIVAGFNVTSVPHSGSGPAVLTLLGGNTMIGTGHPAEIMTHIKAGKLRAIGISTVERDPVLKDVPTLREQGIAFDCAGSVKGIALPANTPKEIVNYYSDLYKKISEDDEFKKIMSDMGQPILYQNPEEFTKYLKVEFENYSFTTYI